MTATRLLLATALAAAPLAAQVFRLSREELVAITKENPFDRFPDGRPKVPDALMQRARGMTFEAPAVRP